MCHRWVLIVTFACSMGIQAGDRTPGRGDSARTPSNIQGPVAAPEPIDPASQRYWSDKCRRERESILSGSPDCRHPAYMGNSGVYGGGYGYPTPYYPGYRPAPETVIINRGDTVVLPPREDEQQPRRGGSLGTWRAR